MTRVKLDFGPWEPDAARLGGTQACEVATKRISLDLNSSLRSRERK